MDIEFLRDIEIYYVIHAKGERKSLLAPDRVRGNVVEYYYGIGAYIELIIGEDVRLIE